MLKTLTPTGNTSHTQPENRAFYPALDGLRCFAFLLVFGQHYFQLPWGSSGVDIFFVLSGFLITGILWDTRHTPHRVANFYVRRTLRIFPLFYGVMVLLLLATPFLHWQLSAVWLFWPLYLGNYLPLIPHLQQHPLLAHAAYFQIHGTLHGGTVILLLGHFWSLCVEEQFYLFWPALVFCCSRRTLLWISAASLPVCLALRLLGGAFLPPWYLQQEVLSFVTPFRMDGLLLGAWIALLLRGPRRQSLLRYSQAALYAAALAIALWMVVSPYGHLWRSPYLYPPWYETWGRTVVPLLAGLILVVSIQETTWLYRLLRKRPFRWIGRLTYGAYVLHDIPHRLYNHIAHAVSPQHQVLIAGLLSFSCTLLLASLSFRYYEAPFLNLKERWTRRAS